MGMTLDEAITNAREVAENTYKFALLSSIHDDMWTQEDDEKCVECAKEHEQIADWLKELKELQCLQQKLKEWISNYESRISSSKGDLYTEKDLIEILKEFEVEDE